MYLFVGMFSSSVLCKHKNGLEQQSHGIKIECQLCSKFLNIKKSQRLITTSLIYFTSQNKTLRLKKKKQRKENKRKHAIFECEIECKFKHIGAVKNNT